MAMKKVYVDIEMGGSKVMDFTVDPVDVLPEHRDGRLVHLVPEGRLYVSDGQTWSALSRVGDLSEFLTAEQVYLKDEVYTKSETYSSAEIDAMGFITKDIADLSNYYGKDELYTRVEVDRKLEAIKQFDFRVVDSLPEVGEWGYIYLVPVSNSKNRNTRNEFIWVTAEDGTSSWEQIGSTAFKLDIIQDESGIVINNTPLQDASIEKDGLMTKEHVKTLESKQDALIAGANIMIEDGVISAVAGGGGAGAAHSTYYHEFGGSGSLEYLIPHKLGTYNILFQIRTASAPIRYIHADVEAVDKDTLKVMFAEPLTQAMVINVMACDKVDVVGSLNIDVKEIVEPSSVWTYINPTEAPLYVQLYDGSGNEIKGDVTQTSTDSFDPVVASLQTASDGYMVVAAADYVEQFTDHRMVSVDLALTEGLDANSKYMVQVYMDSTGQAMGDVNQQGGYITVDFGSNPASGYLVLRKPTMVAEFKNQKKVVVTHNLGRKVGAQVFIDGTGQAMIDIQCSDDNTATLEVNQEISGYILIL